MNSPRLLLSCGWLGEILWWGGGLVMAGVPRNSFWPNSCNQKKRDFNIKKINQVPTLFISVYIKHCTLSTDTSSQSIKWFNVKYKMLELTSSEYEGSVN